MSPTAKNTSQAVRDRMAKARAAKKEKQLAIRMKGRKAAVAARTSLEKNKGKGKGKGKEASEERDPRAPLWTSLEGLEQILRPLKKEDEMDYQHRLVQRTCDLLTWIFQDEEKRGQTPLKGRLYDPKERAFVEEVLIVRAGHKEVWSPFDSFQGFSCRLAYKTKESGDKLIISTYWGFCDDLGHMSILEGSNGAILALSNIAQ